MNWDEHWNLLIPVICKYDTIGIILPTKHHSGEVTVFFYYFCHSMVAQGHWVTVQLGMGGICAGNLWSGTKQGANMGYETPRNWCFGQHRNDVNDGNDGHDGWFILIWNALGLEPLSLPILRVKLLIITNKFLGPRRTLGRQSSYICSVGILSPTRGTKAWLFLVD